MQDPGELENPDAWTGGWYELAIELGPGDDERLEQALEVLWTAARIDGCKALVVGCRATPVDAERSVGSLEQHQLRGRVRVPSGHLVVCAASAVREDNGPDWLDFGIPLGALQWTDQRVGAYPVGRDGGPQSLSWRGALDEWLTSIALAIFERTGFALALIGHEVSGSLYATQVVEQRPPEPRSFGIILPGDPPTYLPANA